MRQTLKSGKFTDVTLSGEDDVSSEAHILFLSEPYTVTVSRFGFSSAQRKFPMDYKTCTICSKGFSDHTKLDLHMKLVHSETQRQNIDRKMMITISGEAKKTDEEVTTTSEDVRKSEIKHIKEEHKIGNKSNDCSECGLIFNSEEECEKHITEKHTERYTPRMYTPMPVNLRGLPLNCDQCNEPYNSGKALMQHMITIHKVKHHLPYNCDYCTMKFSSNQELIDHAQLDELIKKSGPILVNSVIIAENLTAEEGTTHHCTICDNKFTSETEMDDHIEMVHKSIPQNQKIHLKVTGDIKIEDGSQYKLKCSVCKFTTTSDRNMRMHMKAIHSETQKSYKCEQCKTTLRNKGEVLKHAKTKHKDVKCIICGFTAISPSYLKSHIKRKHNKETYQCDECQETMKNKVSLVNHKRTHLVTFKCDLCDFNGKSNKSLQMHKQKSHISNSFTNIGSKRDHSMVPKNNQSNDNSPPNKHKKPDDPKIVGSDNWSKNTNEMQINNKTYEDKKPKPYENKKKKPTNTTKKNDKILPKSAMISNPMIKGMFAEINMEASDHFVRDVTGDGACGTRCLALHCCHSEDQFPKIRKDINKYIIHHWELLGLSGFYGKFDDEGGVTLNVGGYSKTFHSEIEFQCFLDSDEAGLLWIDQIDLQMAANTYKINIHVLSVELEVPKWTHISPDNRLKDHTCGVCEVIKYNMEIHSELLLLHTANHYKLFVPKQSPLADTLGYVASEEKESEQKEQEVTPSLSLRLDTMSYSVEGHSDVDHIKPQEEQAKDLSEVEELKRLVFDLKRENIKLRQKIESQEFTSCSICGKRFANEKTLNYHTQEHNEFANSRLRLKPNYTNTSPKPAVQQQSPAKEKHVRFSKLVSCDQCENLFTNTQLLEAHVKNKHMKYAEIVQFPIDTLECNTCAFVSDTKTELEIHKKENHRKEKEYPCNDCDFQATSRPILRKHRQLVHSKVAETEPTPIEEMEVDEVDNEKEKKKKCQLCEEKFISNSNLAQHRREQHPTYQPCRNMSQCKYNIDCFYSHIPIPEGMSRCFQCGDEFGSQEEMMFHRKETHPESVKICRKYLANQCNKTEGCWWLHIMTDFQQIPIYPAPPDKKQVWSSPQTNQQPNQQTINHTMMSMIQTFQESINMMKMMIQQQTNKQPNHPQN